MPGAFPASSLAATVTCPGASVRKKEPANVRRLPSLSKLGIVCLRNSGCRTSSVPGTLGGLQSPLANPNDGDQVAAGERSTNQAESFFSCLRRAKIGTHHHIAGATLGICR